MQPSRNATQLIANFESCRLVAYQDDKGIWTIGFGHTGPEVVKGLVWTPQEALEHLAADMGFAAHVIQKAVKITINQNQFDALCSLVFNIGCGNFEHSTLLSRVNQGQLVLAAAQFPEWDEERKGGVMQRSVGLLRRRLAERDLFLKSAA